MEYPSYTNRSHAANKFLHTFNVHTQICQNALLWYEIKTPKETLTPLRHYLALRQSVWVFPSPVHLPPSDLPPSD